MKVKKEEDLPILGASLLSEYEAEKFLTQSEREYKNSWWLKGGGSIDVPFIRAEGDASPFGDMDDPLSVRPSLKINIQNTSWQIGDIFIFKNKKFKILSPDIAWMYEDDIGKCAYVGFVDQERYHEYNEDNGIGGILIKRFVDKWFKNEE